jgi:hypothetical protein
MGGGAFNWLKMGGIGAESRNQAEIRLADLLKILSIRAAGRAGSWPGRCYGSLSLISGKNG